MLARENNSEKQLVSLELIKQKIGRMKAKTFASESLMYRAGQDIEDRGNQISLTKGEQEVVSKNETKNITLTN